MCVCVHVYVCYMSVYVCVVCECTQVHVSMHVCMHAHIHACMHSCMYVLALYPCLCLFITYYISAFDSFRNTFIFWNLTKMFFLWYLERKRGLA